MGYCMNQRDASFRIKAENRAKALQAIKDLASRVDEGGGGCWSGGRKVEAFFSWVRTEKFANASTLEDAMSEWRWEIDGAADVDSIMFEGEKLGDDIFLLRAIAPYVEAGSFIEMQGEDGALWRWYFDGTGCIEQEGRVSFS